MLVMDYAKRDIVRMNCKFLFMQCSSPMCQQTILKGTLYSEIQTTECPFMQNEC